MELNNFWAGLVSVLLVSVASLSGVVLLRLNEGLFSSVKTYLIALAVGTLVGSSTFHLLPEAREELPFSLVVALTLLGFWLFVAFERLLHWQHHHLPNEKRGVQPIGRLNLISDGIHNLTDGFVVGLSFMVSIPTGVATTIAVVLHEIPQELGDYAVLVRAGYSKKAALGFNFLSALLAVAGFILAYSARGLFEPYLPHALAFAAGGFIFIALFLGADLKRMGAGGGWQKLCFSVLGFGLMYLMSQIHHHHH